MRKVLLALMVLLVLLTGCITEDRTDKEKTAAEVHDGEPKITSYLPVEQDSVPITGDYTLLNIDDIGQYNIIDAYQFDDYMIIEMWNVDDSALYSYDLNSGELHKMPDTGDYFFVNRICDDKIILGNQTEFWAVDAELTEVSERVTLPEEMFIGRADFPYRFTVQYTVSSDMQKIIYDNPVTGLNYYDLQTGEVCLLFNTEAAPYYYDEYYGIPYRGPEYLSFLPGDDKFYFFSTAVADYGIWVCDLQGNKLWHTDAGRDSDYWGDIWNNRGNSIFNCFADIDDEADGWPYDKAHIKRADLLNQTVDFYDVVIDDAAMGPDIGTPVYSDNYFAYMACEPNPLPDDGITYDETLSKEYNRHWKVKVVELNTGNVQEVLSVDYGWNWQLHSVTDDGRVVFTWQVDGDTDYEVIGITDKVQDMTE